MSRKSRYEDNIPRSPQEGLIFEEALREAEQDHKKIRSLQRHYRKISEKKLPLEYGHLLLLKETLRQRFLTLGEKGLLRCLLERQNLDYTFTCYDTHQERQQKKHGKSFQLDMFPTLHNFSWDELPIRDFAATLKFREMRD